MPPSSVANFLLFSYNYNSSLADVSQFILPKSTGPPLAKRQTSAAASITVSLKSLRNPPLDVTLPNQDINTSILDLKESLSEKESIPVKAIRLLFNKKPVPDSKALKDLAGDNWNGKVEFGVMVIGGAAAVVKKAEVKDEVLKMEGVIGNGEGVLKTDEFWQDLKGFLVQRLKDEAEGERVWGVFKNAVEKS
jgi:hypothetical protein